MTKSHTPGPWTFNPFYGDAEKIAELKKHGMEPTRAQTNEGQVFIMAGDERVALVDPQTKFKRGKGHEGACETRDANARLIARAPQLLDALINLYCAAEKSDVAHHPSLAAARDLIDQISKG